MTATRTERNLKIFTQPNGEIDMIYVYDDIDQFGNSVIAVSNLNPNDPGIDYGTLDSNSFKVAVPKLSLPGGVKNIVFNVLSAGLAPGSVIYCA